MDIQETIEFCSKSFKPKISGKNNSISDSTAHKAIQISTNKKIIELEKTIKAIETSYGKLSREKKIVMEE